MTNDRDLDEIFNLMREAYLAGLAKKSAEIGRRGAELASSVHNAYWRVRFLFWYGTSLVQAGDRNGAQIPLLEAARPDPEADPADQYNAVCELINIGLDGREAGYCRNLIDQGRDYLAGVRKEAWSHKLDFLEGDLEFIRGAFDLAYSCKQRAWDRARQSAEYPRYTMASYAGDLVQTAFALRDDIALTRWQVVLRDCEPVTEGDKVFKQCGLLFLLRARCAAEGLGDTVPVALELLRSAHASECELRGQKRIAIRALAIAGHWAAVDDWLPRLVWDAVDFLDQLVRGDERLCRARHALGIPAKDDEWDQGLEETSPPPSLTTDPARRDQAATFLADARSHYESVRAKAEVEDRRLETVWYTDTLTQRLCRASALVGALR